jgi:ribonuclease P protein component
VAAAAEAGGSSRVGLVVSGRVGGAVVRSRVRRRLRAALGVCGIPPGYDVVVWGSRELVGKNFQEIVSHLEGALEGAGVRG